MTELWFAGSTEEFTPTQLLEQLRAADAAGFDALGCSDHFTPWFPGGQGAAAWTLLPAASQHTERPLFTSVTPILHHYHPAVVAQYFMNLAELHAGGVVLGVGSAEAISEVPLGLDWPPPGEMLRRYERGLEAIRRLWDGETVTMDGGWFRLDAARLYTLAAQRPRMIASAFGPQAAAIAGRWADGLWTLGDPELAQPCIDAYKTSCEEHGRPVGDIVLQAGFHLGEPRDAVIKATKKWKTTQFPKYYLYDYHDLDAMAAEAEERLSDEQFAREGFLVGDDADEQVGRIREMTQLDGVTAVCLQLIGDHDPLTAIRRYGDEVLPALRAAL